MTKRLAIVAPLLTTTLLALSISAAGSDKGEGRSMLSVRGVQQEEGVYKLALEYHPAGDAPHVAGIMVWTEPSHTPVLVHWDGDTSQEVIESFASDKEPLAQTSGELTYSYPRVIIPFEAGDDRSVVVELLYPDGERQIVLGADVDLESFAVDTSFTHTAHARASKSPGAME